MEDFEPMARAIGTGLRREGMAVDVVHDGNDALSHLALTRYDVVVLDRDLPGVHGDEICRRLAAGRSPSRILMLTAAGSLRERVEGLDLGADDYLAKPFDFPELTARVRALGRRAAVPMPPVLECECHKTRPQQPGRIPGRAAADPQRQGVRRPGVPARVGGPGGLRRGMLERVWDEAADPYTTAVRQTIFRLRAKHRLSRSGDSWPTRPTMRTPLSAGRPCSWSRSLIQTRPWDHSAQRARNCWR